MASRELSTRRGGEDGLAQRNDPLTYLQTQINRMFDDLWGGSRWPAESGRVSPPLDVKETEKEIQICAELPGIDSKDLEVELTDEEVTIRGEKRSERESNEKGRYWSERSYGAFERSIRLPSEVDGDKAKSEFNNGVLRITLPKREGAKPRSRKIEVK